VLSQIYGRLIAIISSWVYLLVFLFAFLFTEPQGLARTNSLVVLSILSLIWALLLYRRTQLIEDTAGTFLSSAAQGYVEIKGKVSLYEDEIVRGLGMELPPMVWYRSYFSSSSAGFILEDEKGRCTIDPRDAEVITPIHVYNNRYYHAIYPSESIYVIGQLETLKKHRTEYERDGLIASKVIEWKNDQHNFLDYFDINKDGKIDDSEMLVAKSAAMRKIDNDLELDYQKPPTHVISSPEDGRPFLLSSIQPEKLIHKYKRAIVVHLFAWVYLSVLVLVR